jgi:hypothetical protein
MTVMGTTVRQNILRTTTVTHPWAPVATAEEGISIRAIGLSISGLLVRY